MWIVYGLIDPRTRMIRYIGLSTSGLKRPRTHTQTPVDRAHLHSARWIAGLKRLGIKYEIVILETVPDADYEDLCRAETWWIAYGRASRWPLTNLTTGGGGTFGYRYTNEQRESMSRAAVARCTSAWRERMSRIHKGKKASQETIERQRRASTGKRRTAETRAKISALKMGKPRPPHVLEALRLANLGSKRSPEARQKMSAARVRHGCGTNAAYKRGCRCRECKDAYAKYVREARHAKRSRNRPANESDTPTS